MCKKYSAKHVILAGVIGLAVGAAASPRNATSRADQGDGSAATVSATVDRGAGGKLAFSTRGDDGVLTERMRLTKDGQLLIGKRVGPWPAHPTPLSGIPGSVEVMIDDPSRPGAIVMINEHEPVQGVGNTLAYYASGHGQVFLTSSWLGETRRVAQIDKPPLPMNYPSAKFPEPTSAARFEIGARVNDWVSLAAILEPIADDGRPFVVSDRQHPYLGQVQYLPPSGEWINNRRVGRHALLIGTTHTTGATAGGVVLAGDAYHEYPGKGPVIKSPDGTAYRIVVDDDGKLSTKKF